MADRRQGDRRESSPLQRKALTISVGTFISIVIVFVIILISIFICSFTYKKGYDNGFSDGYVQSLTDTSTNYDDYIYEYENVIYDNTEFVTE